ncbi:glycosyltransferase family 4 protein [Candidatus Fermentibacteria bacterium]|nr:glycosyltransferase family 4 protein [Candidatus Fermentibacteria bacterium]
MPLIAASQVIRFHFLRCGFAAESLRLVYPGVHLPQAFRHHTENDLVRILFCGRIISYKGLHVALLALERLPGRFALTVIGEADATLDYGPQIRHWVTANHLDSRVTFLGGLTHDQVVAEYARHDIVVFPSLWEEPLGLVVLEAMAAGLPVVASRRGAPVELITGGRTGLFHEPGNAVDLARAVQELSCASRRQEIGQAARESIRQRFDFDRYIEDIEGIVTSLARERRGG